MTITYPRDLRTLHDSGIRLFKPVFDLVPRIATIPLQSRLQAMETAPAIWKASFSTAHLTREKCQQVVAWLDSLGGARSFYAFDPFRRWPVAHPTGAGLTATYQSVGLTATTVSLAFPTGKTLSPGDHIGLELGAIRFLARVTEGATSSGVITVSFAPAVLPSRFSSLPVVRINSPVVEMILTPGERPQVQDHVVRQSVSFSAIQRQ